MKQRSLPPSSEGGRSAPIILIEKRALIRESLARRLGEELGCAVDSFPNIDSWRKASSGVGAQFILVAEREKEHEALHAPGGSETAAALIVLSDTTDFDDILRGLKRGVFTGPANRGLRL
jgi:hypothetical protein